MSKLILKKRFKHDVISDSETELINKNQKEMNIQEKVVVKYVCDQFDFDKLIVESDLGNLNIDINSLKFRK